MKDNRRPSELVAVHKRKKNRQNCTSKASSNVEINCCQELPTKERLWTLGAVHEECLKKC